MPQARPAASGRVAGPDRRPLGDSDVLATIPDRASLVTTRDGVATHAVIPYDDYLHLVALQAAREAIPILEDPNAEWIELEDALKMFAGDRITAARKARGLTQAQLGKLVGVPQSQISRLERRPEAATIKFLRRVAKALKVDVSELV